MKIHSSYAINMLVIGLLIGSTLQLSAQATYQRTLGDTNADDVAHRVIAATNSNYLVVGETDASGAGNKDGYVTKFDEYGNIVWSRTYGGTSHDMFKGGQALSNGDFLFVGSSMSFGWGQDIYVVRTDANGFIVWNKSYGGGNSDWGYTAIELSNGNIIVAGGTQSYGAGGADAYVIKIDSAGSLLWANAYGGAASDFALDLLELPDGDIMVAGATASYGAGSRDMYLIRINSNGGVIWTKTYGDFNDDECNSILWTSDGGFLLSGKSEDASGLNDAHVIKTDSSGNVQWERDLGSTSWDVIEAGINTSDGGYAFVGWSSSFSSSVDLLLIKMDALGTIEWSKIYGDTDQERGYSLIEATDGGFVLAGVWTVWWEDYLYVVKTDSSGNTACNSELIYPMDTTAILNVSSGVATASGGQPYGVNYTSWVLNAGGTDSVICFQCLNLTAVSVAPSCAGSSDGSIAISGTGGTGAYTYNWSTGATTSSLTGVTAGSYDVTVTSQISSCYGTTTVEISEPSPMLIYGLTSQAEPGMSDGGIELSVSGASPPYTYIWDNGQTSSSIAGLSAGTYFVTVTDQNGCAHVESYQITESKLSQYATFQKVFDADSMERIKAIQQLENGYILGGNVASSGMGHSDIVLIRLDSLANLMWAKTYGGPPGLGTGNDVCWGLEVTNDNGFLIAGWTESFSPISSLADAYLIRTDSAGDTLWTKAYGGINADATYDLQKTSDGGYLLIGEYNRGFLNGGQDVYSIRVDSIGDTLWTQIYGGDYNEIGLSAKETNDGGYIIAGVTNRSGVEDALLIKTNSLGDTLWTRTYGSSNGYERAYTVLETVSGYVLSGSSLGIGQGEDADIYVISTNLNGDTLWTRSYGGPGNESAHSMILSDDGGLVLSGSTTSNPSDSTDVFLMKIDILGNLVWTSLFGGDGFDDSWNVIQSADGGYVLGGVFGSQNLDEYDAYLIKTDPNGRSVCDKGTVPFLIKNTNTVVGSNFDTTGVSNTAVYATPTNVDSLSIIDSTICSCVMVIEMSKGDNPCYGANSGYAAVNASLGTPGYSYAWSNNSFLDSNYNITSGIYVVTVSDNEGCQRTDSIEVLSPPMLTGTIASMPDTNGMGVGMAVITVSGGTPPMMYTWTPSGGVDSIATGLTAGEHVVGVIDANGCSYSDTTTVGLVTGTGHALTTYFQMRVLPNPSAGDFSVLIEVSQDEEFELQLVNMMGQVVHEAEIKSSQGTAKQQFYLGHLPKGIYSLNVISDNITETRIISIR